MNFGAPFLSGSIHRSLKVPAAARDITDGNEYVLVNKISKNIRHYPIPPNGVFESMDFPCGVSCLAEKPVETFHGVLHSGFLDNPCRMIDPSNLSVGIGNYLKNELLGKLNKKKTVTLYHVLLFPNEEMTLETFLRLLSQSPWQDCDRAANGGGNPSSSSSGGDGGIGVTTFCQELPCFELDDVDFNLEFNYFWCRDLRDLFKASASRVSVWCRFDMMRILIFSKEIPKFEDLISSFDIALEIFRLLKIIELEFSDIVGMLNSVGSFLNLIEDKHEAIYDWDIVLVSSSGHSNI